MKLTFRHRFTDGRRAVMTLRGANGRPRIQWPDGMPTAEPARSEYRAWMLTALQEAANHYGRQILYVLPYDDCTVVASICPTAP
jgi:hypothetical protein